MEVMFEQSPEAKAKGIHAPSKGNSTDSGFDIFCPCDLVLSPGERKTVGLAIKFKLLEGEFGSISMEAQIRPKSGRSKGGFDVELGTIDNGYRNYVGATITNTTNKDYAITKNEKICQIVFVPVFNNVQLVDGHVDATTERALGGFGSTGLTK